MLRRLLVTGGTGSFGHTVAEQLSADFRVRIFSRDEKKQWDMRQRYPDFEYVIGDIRDEARVAEAMYGVDVVFHAAALKQVPNCEDHPLEATKTNVIGSANVCRAAHAAGVQQVVALSSDKAVEPINAMGMTKALMERIVCAHNTGTGTVFSCVRYGNVLCSRGSVVPLFVDQVSSGRPITITDPDMTRFLLLLGQAVDLVRYALRTMQGGEIFVQRAPAATVAELAASVQRVIGVTVPTTVVGARPGEKTHETLVAAHEAYRTSQDGSIMTIHPQMTGSDHLRARSYRSDNADRTSGPELDALMRRALQSRSSAS